MNKVKVGNIVKFYDGNGSLNGGTVKDFIREKNEELVLINSLDGKVIKKRKTELTPIQRQQRGRVSAKYLDVLRGEIARENGEEITQETSGDVSKVEESAQPNEVEISKDKQIDELRRKLLVRDQAVNDYKDMVDKLQKEIGELKKVASLNRTPVNSENLVLTIKALSDALLAAAMNKEGDMVLELTGAIKKLNGIDG